MNPEQSHRLVKQTLQADFDRQRFVEFIDKLLKRVDFTKQFMQSGLNIRRAFIDKVNSFERIGQYTDSDGKKIDVLIVNLKRDVTLERGRTGLRNFAADYLQSDRGAGKSAVLIAYVSNSETDWRFSYVTLEKDLQADEKGKFKEEVTKLTPARRYSFLVGKSENSHTAQRQFFELLNNPAPKLQNIEDAFNIEKVTKEFFAEYKLLFEKVRNELDKLCSKNKAVRDEFVGKGLFTYAKDEDGDEILDRNGNRVKEPSADDFAKKLLGQVVFLYFLQKKGWFGVERDEQWGTGDKNFLRTLLSANTASTNFFDSVLEPLFYNALAVKREHDWSDRFNCKIPFLNGGLFEPLNGYDWVHIELNLPNTLFSNSETSSQGDKGTGILDVFDRYNFTINESEPLEVEVAVDPEMLGKIFENLLPENIRHGSGTYYTPRVIVAYMCQQSLINYLASQLGEVPREDLETFVRFGALQRDYTEAGTQSQAERFLPQSIIENASAIDDKLKHITVCDPAVGSGAFPVGMMHEIVKAREALQSVEGIEQLSQYELKRQTIENSLYGVDIDSGAVEIAKLRLWLSLIVDEAEFKTIEPLPNLDFKIMQGNSLLDEFHGVKLIDEKLFKPRTFDKASRIREIDEEVAELWAELRNSNVGKQSPMYVLTNRRITELTSEKTSLKDGSGKAFQSGLFVADESHERLEKLKQKHDEIFDETRKDVKERLRREAERLEWEFIEAKLRADGKTHELADLEEQRNDRRKDYFLWQLNFPEIFQRGGFDVVIGNPPYLNVEQITSEVKARFAANYKTFYKRFDVFGLFFERSLTDLTATGQAIFIIPSQILNNLSYRKLRELFLTNKWLREVFYLGDKIFESASNDVCVLFLDKNGVERIRLIDALGFEQRKFVEVATDYFDKFNGVISFSVDEASDSIFQKIFDPTFKKLKDYATVFQGIVAGSNEAFLPTSDAIRKGRIEKRLLRPVLLGRDFEKWHIRNDERRILYIDGNVDIKQFPNAFAHLSRFKRDLIGSKSSEEKSSPWYCLHRPRVKSQLEFTPKLLVQRTRNPRLRTRIVATIDETGYYGMESIIFLVPEDSQTASAYFLLGLLNSTLLNFLYQTKFLNVAVKAEYLKDTPIPKTSSTQRDRIERLVKQALAKKQRNADSDVSEIEAAIDREVFELYGLTKDEIHLIQNYQH